MRRAFLWTLGIAVGLTVALVATVFGPVWLAVYKVQRAERALGSPAILEQAIRSLVPYCNAVRPGISVGGAGWLPRELQELHPAPTGGDLSDAAANVEFGGGFHHWGLTLRRDGMDSWTVETYSEDDWVEPHQLSMSLGEHFSREELLRRLRESYQAYAERMAATDPDAAQRARSEQMVMEEQLLGPDTAPHSPRP